MRLAIRIFACEMVGVLALLSIVPGAEPASVPTSAPTSSPTSRPALRIVSREEWGSRPDPIPPARRQTPRLFTLHHAGEVWPAGGDPVVTLRKLQSYGQREKHWPDLPYHYIIAPDGTVYEGRDWHYQPESNTSYDLDGVLNIELLGNFEEQRGSPA